MKHIFYAHSNICLLVIFDIINSHKIERKDIIVFYARGLAIHNIDEIKQINIDDFNKIGVLRWNIFLSLYECLRFDHKIKKLIDDDLFYAYIPQSTIPAVELLITNKYCKGFYYIEEGSASYEDIKDLNPLFVTRFPLPKRIKSLGWLNRIYTHKFYDLDKAISVFCTDIKAFPNADNKIILENVFKPTISNLSSTSENKLYCVFDGISSYYDKYRSAHIISFIRGMKKLISKKNYKEIIIKFHPNQYSTGENILFENVIKTEPELNLKVCIMHKDYIFENLILERKNIDILTLSSSLGIYAKKMGHNIFTFYSFFEELAQVIDCNDLHLAYIKKITNNFIQV